MKHKEENCYSWSFRNKQTTYQLESHVQQNKSFAHVLPVIVTPLWVIILTDGCVATSVLERNESVLDVYW